jgi:hypothetical protein
MESTPSPFAPSPVSISSSFSSSLTSLTGFAVSFYHRYNELSRTSSSSSSSLSSLANEVTQALEQLESFVTANSPLNSSFSSSIRSDLVFLYYLRGRFLSAAGNSLGAIASFTRSLLLDPLFAEGFYYRALTLFLYGTRDHCSDIPSLTELRDLALLSPQTLLEQIFENSYQYFHDLTTAKRLYEDRSYSGPALNEQEIEQKLELIDSYYVDFSQGFVDTMSTMASWLQMNQKEQMLQLMKYPAGGKMKEMFEAIQTQVAENTLKKKNQDILLSQREFPIGSVASEALLSDSRELSNQVFLTLLPTEILPSKLIKSHLSSVFSSVRQAQKSASGNNSTRPQSSASTNNEAMGEASSSFNQGNQNRKRSLQPDSGSEGSMISSSSPLDPLIALRINYETKETNLREKIRNLEAERSFLVVELEKFRQEAEASKSQLQYIAQSVAVAARPVVVANTVQRSSKRSKNDQSE